MVGELPQAPLSQNDACMSAGDTCKIPVRD